MKNVTTTSTRRSLLCTVLGSAIMPMASIVGAQPKYPSRTVVVVSPFSAGGLNDMCSRAVARGLQQTLNETVVVENRPGGNTMIGLEHVARSAPDGHTLVTVSDANMTYLPSLMPNLSFSLEKDFAPITMIGIVPMVIIVRPGLDVNSVRDLIALAKAQPGKLNFASAGVGTAPHMTGELFKFRAGVNMVHVPYKGAMLAVTDVIAGHVDLMFADLGTALNHIKSGKVRAIAITTKERKSTLPDLPPIADTLDGFDARLWIGMAARAGTPVDIIRRLNHDIVASLQKPEIGGLISSQGMTLATNSVEEFTRMIAEDRMRFAKIIRSGGIKLED